MQIIRIEHHASGIGIFRNPHNNAGTSYLLQDLCTRHLDFPTPWAEGYERLEHEFCAFKSIAQLQEWVMDYEFEELFSMGFRVYLIDVSEAVVLQQQVIFEKCNITNQKDISELFINHT